MTEETRRRRKRPQTEGEERPRRKKRPLGEEREDGANEERARGKARSGKRKKRKKPVSIVEAPEGTPEYQAEWYDSINSWEEDAWSDNSRGHTTGMENLDRAIGGLQPGFHVIGGDSNIGKTSFISQIAWNVATLNKDAYVIDFSLDDARRDKMARVVAASQRVPINVCKSPALYMDKYPAAVTRRGIGLSMLRKYSNAYKAFAEEHSSDVDDIKDTIQKNMIELKKNGSKRRVVVFIDNFHDLTTSNSAASGSDKAKYTFLAEHVADMAKELDIAIICTAELKKLNGFRRPQLDDLREAVKIKYEAKSVWMAYNEVSLRGEAASVYFEKAGDPAKQPIFELKIEKNKFDSFKGRLFFEGYPEMAYFIEADKESSKAYGNVIYSNE